MATWLFCSSGAQRTPSGRTWDPSRHRVQQIIYLSTPDMNLPQRIQEFVHFRPRTRDFSEVPCKVSRNGIHVIKFVLCDSWITVVMSFCICLVSDCQSTPPWMFCHLPASSVSRWPCLENTWLFLKVNLSYSQIQSPRSPPSKLMPYRPQLESNALSIKPTVHSGFKFQQEKE